VDGVKVDVQATVTMLGEGRGGSAVASREMIQVDTVRHAACPCPRAPHCTLAPSAPALVPAYQGFAVRAGPEAEACRACWQSMEASVAKSFGSSNCINCMCHPLECLYSYRSTNIARASEDFYPRDPASHTLHVANVAYNSLFLGEIVFPDWDMFQSTHSAATLHGVARAIGGCAVYVSDKPGQHDPAILSKLVLPDGHVLRARRPGRPTRDSLFHDVTKDGKTACKIFNVNACGGGVVGAFNLQGSHWDRVGRRMLPNGGPQYQVPSVEAAVSALDFEAAPRVAASGAPAPLASDGVDALFARFSTHWALNGTLIDSRFDLVSPSDLSCVSLAPKECAVYTFAPVWYVCVAVLEHSCLLRTAPACRVQGQTPCVPSSDEVHWPNADVAFA